MFTAQFPKTQLIFTSQAAITAFLFVAIIFALPMVFALAEYVLSGVSVTFLSEARLCLMSAVFFLIAAEVIRSRSNISADDIL